jgi:phosphodiesterase/alkaline phosphatase D-like protein
MAQRARPVLPDALPRLEDDWMFPLGVQAGDVDQTSVRLWSYAPIPRDVNLWLWDAEGTVLRTEPMSVDRHGVTGPILEGLTPGAEYFYAFCTEGAGARSAIGRFVTAFADGERRPLTIAAATCTHTRTAPWRALERTALLDFDLVLHLGDMSYNDAARTESDYHAEWRRTLADPGYRALLPRAATYHAWDDHEFWNDADAEQDPERMEIAREAFYACRPQRRGPDGQAWQSHRWGDTVEFFVLDTRTERLPSTREDEAIYLGRQQMDWLKEGLTESSARFKVLMNSVPFTRMPDFWLMSHDRWQGYERQRGELLELLEDDDVARGTLILSGDFHVGFVSHVEVEGTHRRLNEVAVGPSGNINPLGGDWLRDFAFPDDRFDWASDRLSATTLRFDPDAGEVTVTFVDAETGDVSWEQVLRPGEDDEA